VWSILREVDMGSTGLRSGGALLPILSLRRVLLESVR